MNSSEYQTHILERANGNPNRVVGMLAIDLVFLETLKHQLNLVTTSDCNELQTIIKDTADRISLLLNTYTHEKYKF